MSDTWIVTRGEELYEVSKADGSGDRIFTFWSRANALDKAEELNRADNEVARARRLIADDAYAMSFQTMAQYRAALLKALA